MGGGRRRRMSVYSSPSQTRKWHVSAKEQKVKLAHPGPQTLISYSANFHSQRNLLSGGASKFQGGIALKKEGPKKYLGLGEISLGRCQNQASSLPYFKSRANDFPNSDYRKSRRTRSVAIGLLKTRLTAHKVAISDIYVREGSPQPFPSTHIYFPPSLVHRWGWGAFPVKEAAGKVVSGQTGREFTFRGNIPTFW